MDKKLSKELKKNTEIIDLIDQLDVISYNVVVKEYNIDIYLEVMGKFDGNIKKDIKIYGNFYGADGEILESDTANLYVEGFSGYNVVHFSLYDEELVEMTASCKVIMVEL